MWELILEPLISLGDPLGISSFRSSLEIFFMISLENFNRNSLGYVLKISSGNSF